MDILLLSSNYLPVYIGIRFLRFHVLSSSLVICSTAGPNLSAHTRGVCIDSLTGRFMGPRVQTGISKRLSRKVPNRQGTARWFAFALSQGVTKYKADNSCCSIIMQYFGSFQRLTRQNYKLHM